MPLSWSCIYINFDYSTKNQKPVKTKNFLSKQTSDFLLDDQDTCIEIIIAKLHDYSYFSLFYRPIKV